MPLSREQIQRLRDARDKVGSVQLLRSYVNTHGADEEQIAGMIRQYGADGALDRMFGLAPARQVRQPEMATVAAPPGRPSPGIGGAAATSNPYRKAIRRSTCYRTHWEDDRSP
jgi:hypothetical protein